MSCLHNIAAFQANHAQLWLPILEILAENKNKINIELDLNIVKWVQQKAAAMQQK
jgi:hypothetical protein